jgi:hypothetical protein
MSTPAVRLLAGTVVSGLVLASAVTISVSPDTAEARKRCGEVRAHDTTVSVIVRRGRVPCRRARRIVRNNFLYAGPPVRGWFCFTAHGSPGRPPRYGGACAPTGQDPDTARRSILIGRPRAAVAARSCDTRNRSGAYCKRGRRVFGFHPYD